MSGKKFNVNEVLNGIKRAQIEGFKDIKINTVVRKGVNEKSILGLVDYCRSEGHILRFIEYMDVGTLNSWDIKNVVSSNDIIKTISKKYDLVEIEKNYPSETSDRFSFVDGKGEIGFISSISLRRAHGSITTPLPKIEILFFLTIPDGSNLNLNTFLSITSVWPALCPP